MDNEEIDEARRLWLANPHTQRAARKQRESRQKALAHLISRCAVSTDPQVRAAHGALESIDEILKELE